MLCSIQITLFPGEALLICWATVVMRYCDWLSCFRAMRSVMWLAYYVSQHTLFYIHLHDIMLHPGVFQKSHYLEKKPWTGYSWQHWCHVKSCDFPLPRWTSHRPWWQRSSQWLTSGLVFVDIVMWLRSEVCTGCCILNRMLYAIPVSDLLSGWSALCIFCQK